MFESSNLFKITFSESFEGALTTEASTVWAQFALEPIGQFFFMA